MALKRLVFALAAAVSQLVSAAASSFIEANRSSGFFRKHRRQMASRSGPAN